MTLKVIGYADFRNKIDCRWRYCRTGACAGVRICFRKAGDGRRSGNRQIQNQRNVQQNRRSCRRERSAAGWDQDRHRRTIERRISDALRKHKERAKVLRISKFGLMEMTRQRQRQSFNHSVFRECPRCSGSGRVKAPESVALEIMRRIRLASQGEGVARIDVRVSSSVANDLLNRKRYQLSELERQGGQTIRIQPADGFAVSQVVLSCSDRRGREVHPVAHSASAHQGSAVRATRSRSRQPRGRSRGR